MTKNDLKRLLRVGVGLLTMVGGTGIVSAVTANTTISSVISPVISLSTSGTVNLNITPTGSGAQTIDKDVATVSTNDSVGYTLVVANASATVSAMTSGGNNLPASSGSQTTPVAQSVNTWGYRVDGVGGFGAGPTSAVSNQAIGAVKFAGIPLSAAPNTIKTTSGPASNDTTNIWYAVAANTNQASGTYTANVTYTATAN